MLVRLRQRRLETVLPLIQFAAVAVAVHADTGWGSVAALAVLLVTGFFGWLRAIRHARLIDDTPTSRIASAAQGYVELRGRAQALDGTPLLSPVDGLPVLWYRVVTERKRSDGKWHRVSTDESDTSFLLEDGSGTCAVDPEGAEMMVGRRDVTLRGDTRYTQHALIRNDTVYVLGDFTTIGSIDPDFNVREQVRELLASWKKDHPRLLERFDLDGNGELDLQEWELARQQARREVERRRDEAMAAPEAHLVRRPSAGRLYLISDFDPGRIARRYRWLALFHIVLFLAAIAGLAWFSQVGII